MAIQIWDAQAGQYKSADLARFGGSGTLTEALVWDGTQYVKVWPSEPSLPVVQITGTGGNATRDQFRAACTQHGVDYQTVQELPFLLDTSQSTNLNNLFRDCSSLTTVPNIDTSQATNLTSMFYGCSSLTTVPNMDTSRATTLAFMFRDCSSLTSVPDMVTSQVKNTYSMFYGCSSLTHVPDMDTSNVTNAGDMFYSCTSLTDGNVRLIGKHPSVNTTNMIFSSGLTREPFYDTNGNPI